MLASESRNHHPAQRRSPRPGELGRWPLSYQTTLFGTQFGATGVSSLLGSIHLQRRMPALRAMPRANPTDPANPLISGATSSMSERDICPSGAILGARFSEGGCRECGGRALMARMQQVDRLAPITGSTR